MLTLEQVRQEIQDTDSRIIKELAHRKELVKRVSKLKKQLGMDITDEAQEQKNFEAYERLAHEGGLDFKWVQELFLLILSHSKKIQQDLSSV